MLFPRPSRSRQIIDLSGIWQFQLDQPGDHFTAEWAGQDLPQPQPMAVPGQL